jgi:hypothetical protein
LAPIVLALANCAKWFGTRICKTLHLFADAFSEFFGAHVGMGVATFGVRAIALETAILPVLPNLFSTSTLAKSSLPCSAFHSMPLYSDAQVLSV